MDIDSITDFYYKELQEYDKAIEAHGEPYKTAKQEFYHRLTIAKKCFKFSSVIEIRPAELKEQTATIIETIEREPNQPKKEEKVEYLKKILKVIDNIYGIICTYTTYTNTTEKDPGIEFRSIHTVWRKNKKVLSGGLDLEVNRGLIDIINRETYYKATGNREKTDLTKLQWSFIEIEIKIRKEEAETRERQQKEIQRLQKELNSERQQKNKAKFKVSGHLQDQKLKYSYPKDNNGQLSIFDSLKDETKKDIEVAGVEVAQIVEGIKLSPSETKVIDCLCKLLHETSQTSDAKKEDYYSGNIGYELVEYGGDKNTLAPKLAFTLYELTREYKGGETIGGKDVENVKQILTELDSKRFLLSYVETTKKKDGGRIERKIEDFRKLIHIVKISQTEYNKEDIELSKKEETIILLNPIFRRQIDSKFILYPNDINRRTIIAYGSHNVSDITLRLRDYLLRLHSSPKMSREITLDRLYYLVAEKWMRESRKKKVKEYTEKALETVKALGLLLSYEIKTASTGEPKIVFTLNKDWE